MRGAAPELVDPATTALWEMRLDEVLTGKADYQAVIDGVATAARELIEALVQRSNGKVDLITSTQTRRSGRRRSRQDDRSGAAKSASASPRRRASKAKSIASAESVDDPRARRSKAPTDKMVAYAQNLARARKVKLPEAYLRDFDACRRFLDEHAR